MLPRVFLNAVPKTGAHLVERALELMGYRRGQRSIGSAAVIGRKQLVNALLRRPVVTADMVIVGIEMPAPVRSSWVRRRLGGTSLGEYLRGHVRYSEYFEHLLREREFHVIHMVRDPRDVVVSHAHYIMNRPRHPFHRHYRGLGEFANRLTFSITGGKIPGVGYLDSITERFRAMEKWSDYPRMLTLRFEDLVGPGGGGSAEAQARSLSRLCELLDIEETPDLRKTFEESLFGRSSTFRKGQIGGWRESFDQTRLELFRTVAGDLLDRWGYSSDS